MTRNMYVGPTIVLGPSVMAEMDFVAFKSSTFSHHIVKNRVDGAIGIHHDKVIEVYMQLVLDKPT